MERGDGDLEARRIAVRRELWRRRQALRAREYVAAVRRLEEAAAAYAEEDPADGSRFLERVLEGVARLPAVAGPRAGATK